MMGSGGQKSGEWHERCGGLQWCGGSREHFGGAGDLGVCWLVRQCGWY